MGRWCPFSCSLSWRRQCSASPCQTKSSSCSRHGGRDCWWGREGAGREGGQNSQHTCTCASSFVPQLHTSSLLPTPFLLPASSPLPGLSEEHRGLAEDPAGVLNSAESAGGDPVLGQVFLHLPQVGQNGSLREDALLHPQP